MIRVCICDNDKQHCSEMENMLCDYLKQNASLDIEIDIFYSGESLLKKMKASIENYQILFLDIEMNTMNGIETARAIRKQDKNMIIIYVTGYDKYTLESFEVSPFRYVLKPIKKDKIGQVFLQAIEEVKTTNQYFFFNYQYVDYQLKAMDIISIISEKGRMLRIITDNNRKEYTFYGRIRDLKSQLNPFFFVKINQGTIINLDHVHIISKGDIQMTNGTLYTISRGKKASVKLAYHAYIQRRMGI